MPNSNTFYKIVSVVIAIVLWAYVIQVVEPMKSMTISDVPVQLLNEDSLTSRGLAISGEASYTVDVVVEGKRTDLSKLTSGEIVANADLFAFGIGKNYVPAVVSAPDGITVMEVQPNKIAVNIEELVSVAKPVKAEFAGQFEDGMEAGQISTLPEQIQVSGAKSEVDAVAYIKAVINASKLNVESKTIKTRAVAVNSGGDIVNNVDISSTYIDVTAKLCQVKEVPLNIEIIGKVASIYEVLNLDVPTSVKIKGTKDAISAIKGLTGSAIDISKVSITSSLPVKIPLPNGVEFASGYESMMVDIGIKPAAKKEFTYTANEIKVEGIDGVSNIFITTPQITVVASGSEAVINNLQKDDIEPYINLDAVSLLSATAEVMVRYDKQLGHITVDPEEVRITLNQEQ